MILRNFMPSQLPMRRERRPYKAFKRLTISARTTAFTLPTHHSESMRRADGLFPGILPAVGAAGTNGLVAAHPRRRRPAQLCHETLAKICPAAPPAVRSKPRCQPLLSAEFWTTTAAATATSFGTLCRRETGRQVALNGRGNRIPALMAGPAGRTDVGAEKPGDAADRGVRGPRSTSGFPGLGNVGCPDPVIQNQSWMGLWISCSLTYLASNAQALFCVARAFSLPLCPVAGGVGSTPVHLRGCPPQPCPPIRLPARGLKARREWPRTRRGTTESSSGCLPRTFWTCLPLATARSIMR